MLFAIDVGNTNFTIGLFDGKELVKTFRMITKTSRTSDEFGVFFGEWLMLNGFSVKDVDSVIIASVVPDVMHSQVSDLPYRILKNSVPTDSWMLLQHMKCTADRS